MTKNLIAFQTLLRKEIVRFMRIWTQTLLPPAITMTLYFVIFGKLIGSQIHPIHGFAYIQFIVPGLVMMAIMTNAYSNTVTSFFGAKFSKSIEEMLVSSMPDYVILAGYVIGGVLRGFLVGGIVLFISMFFTSVHIQHWVFVLVMSVMIATVFSLGGLINGIFAKKFDDVSFIPTFILTPLTYLGGVFYSLHQLPVLGQKLSILNPIFTMVDAFRYGCLGVSDLKWYVGLIWTLILLLALLTGSLYLLRRGIGLRN